MVCRASEGDKEVTPTRMSLDDAYQLLGVRAGASFEDVLQARNKMKAQHESDRDKIYQIDAAYDTLFSYTLNKRLSGELEVSTSVKYADVPNAKKKSSGTTRPGDTPGVRVPSLPVAIGNPGKSVAVTQAAVFGVLAFWALLQALLEPPRMAATDVAGLQFGLAAGYGFYTFYKTKQMPIGKAVGLTIACLFAGGLIGQGVQNWLRVDLMPIGAFGSPGVMVTEFVIIGIWLGCTFIV